MVIGDWGNGGWRVESGGRGVLRVSCCVEGGGRGVVRAARDAYLFTCVHGCPFGDGESIIQARLIVIEAVIPAFRSRAEA